MAKPLGNLTSELSQIKQGNSSKDIHSWFLEPLNRVKSLRLIWQRFSYLLDEWIAKKKKKKKIAMAFQDNPHYLFWDAHGQSDKSENIFGIWY